MQVIDWQAFLEKDGENPASAATVGVFDGVHIGHQALIRKTVHSGYFPMVISFRKNPKQTLFSQIHFKEIIALEEKLSLFEKMGVQKTVLIDFSESFRKLRGRDFIETLIEKGNTRILIIGHNFHCGYKLDTDAEAVKKTALERGIKAEIVPPVTANGERVSSSAIRAAINAGDFSKASAFLGFSYDFLRHNPQS
jgi:riboflavin kinase/FMN adenylyltransferase